MGTVWVFLTFILVYHSEGLGEELPQKVINRGLIRCFGQDCAKNQVFRPCTEDQTKDVCINCPEGYFMPDRIDTATWTEPPDCIKNDCNDCDPNESVLDNPKECGDTEKARCVCDRTKDYYGENDPGVVTSCTLKTGDLCHRRGVQLNQKGDCEPCPSGTEKNSDDSSLCTKIEITTSKQGTEFLTKLSTPVSQTTPSYRSSTVQNRTTPPTSNSDGIGVVIGVITGVVLLIIIVSLSVCCYLRKYRLIDNKRKTDSEKCCPVERDSTSESSSASSDTVLLRKGENMKQLDNNGYPVKPVMAVTPMISVDESEKDEEFDYSLNAGGFFNGTDTENNVSGDRDRTMRTQSELDSLQDSATEVKIVYSRDETDLKVPVQNGANGGEDLNRTSVKTVYSEETEVKHIRNSPARRILDRVITRITPFVSSDETAKKQIASSDSRRILDSDSTGVKPFVSSDETAKKQIAGSDSRGILDSDSTGVKPFVSSDETAKKQIAVVDSRRILDSNSTGVEPFVSSEETPLKEIGREHSSRALNNVSNDLKASVPPEATSSNKGNSYELQAKIPVAPVRTFYWVSPSIPPALLQRGEGSDQTEVGVSQASPANQRQRTSNVLTNQNNSVQPTMCHLTDNSESPGSDTVFRISSMNEHKNTINNITFSHHNQKAEMNPEESSLLDMQPSPKMSEEIDNIDDSDLCTEKTRGHSHSKTVSGESIISEGSLNSADNGESVELVFPISSYHQPKVEPNSSQQSGAHHPNQYVPHQQHQSNPKQLVQSNLHQLAQSSPHQPDQSNQQWPNQSSEHQPDQSNQNQTDQSRLGHLNNGVEIKSVSSVPIRSGVSSQNSNASYAQMSGALSVQNSGATSGYGTARRSEMGTFTETENNRGHNRSVDNTSSTPPIVNSLLRSESCNAGDHLDEGKIRSSESLGLNGMINAPFLNPESSDEVKQLEEVQVPMVIKKEQENAVRAPEGEIESSRYQVLNQAFVAQNGRAESGYCS